ncbi:MAG TPA: hypothetical protein VLA37_11245, partial [Sphingomonadaceae bacterium]|nr:hypothetical protein [Sphingomonadaceae bacterium]
MSDLRVGCIGCSKYHYLRAGTLMEGSCLPLKSWFEAMWLMTIKRNGISTSFISDYLGIGVKAAHRMRKKIGLHIEKLCDRG